MFLKQDDMKLLDLRQLYKNKNKKHALVVVVVVISFLFFFRGILFELSWLIHLSCREPIGLRQVTGQRRIYPRWREGDLP